MHNDANTPPQSSHITSNHMHHPQPQEALKSKEVEGVEECCGTFTQGDKKVYSQLVPLAQAKAIQGLRAMFDEVGFYQSGIHTCLFQRFIILHVYAFIANNFLNILFILNFKIVYILLSLNPLFGYTPRIILMNECTIFHSAHFHNVLSQMHFSIHLKIIKQKK